MSFIIIYIIVIGLQSILSANFLHESSYVAYSPDTENTNDFGFSLAYFKKDHKLVIGAPHATIDGAVFSCPIEETSPVEVNSTVTCSNNNINIDDLAGNYSRVYSENQNFCLGASLTVTDSYFFTCAPLWSKYMTILNGSQIYGAFGSCFVSGVETKRYNGWLEQYDRRDFGDDDERTPEFDDIYGGVGWNTLANEEDDIILIAKSPIHSTMSYIPASKPLTKAKNVRLNGVGLTTYKYKGRAIAAGKFFSDYKTVYAFSMEKDKRTGAIAFLYYYAKNKKLLLVQHNAGATRTVLFENNAIGSMFGSALLAAEVSRAPALVAAAPAHACSERGLDVGAVYIYVGGGKAKSQKTANLCICGKKDRGRFGTAISSMDLNEDNHSELFISAPYEDDGLGAIYVISGYELNKLLQSKPTSRKILVTELTHTQRIQNKGFSNFGYSLQAIPNINERGDAMAVSSPGAQRVLLYRGVPALTVLVTARLRDKEVIYESDKEFIVRIETNVTYPKRVRPTASLIVTAIVTANAVTSLDSNDNVIDLSSMQTTFYNDLRVVLHDRETGKYKFEVEVNISKSSSNPEVFDSGTVTFSERSNTRASLDVTRICDNDECVADLHMNLEWGGSETTYELGSSAQERARVWVRNDAERSDVACARLRLAGAPVTQLMCDQEGLVTDWYQCNFFGFNSHEERTIDILLDMRKLTNKDKMLEIEVLLYNICGTSVASARHITTIPYTLNTDEISIEEHYLDQNITASAIQDEHKSDFEINVLFSIVNNGSVLFQAIEAELFTDEILRRNFMIDCSNGKVDNLDTSTNHSRCLIDIPPHSVIRVLASIYIKKEEIMSLFVKDRLLANVTLNLHLNETVVKTKVLTTTLYYVNDITFGQNQKLILIIACVLAALLLAIVIFALYKIGFFKRKTKKQLNELRASIKRPAPGSSQRNLHANRNSRAEMAAAAQSSLCQTDLQNDDTEEDIELAEIEAVEDDVFFGGAFLEQQPTDTRDSISLIKDKHLIFP